jgi:hypothetical protein
MPQRQFIDSEGQAWTVWDVVPSRVAQELDAAWLARHEPENTEGAPAVRPRASLPDRFAGGWLCFERAGEKRRLAPVPSGWHRLTSLELEALRNRAPQVPARLSADTLTHG